MTHTYQIDGMHCGSCIAKVKNELLKLGDVTDASVQLESPQATITMLKHISTPTLQQAVARAGNFSLREVEEDKPKVDDATDKNSWLATYKPLLLIFAFIAGIAFITSTQHGQFEWMHWMRNFMGGFFITFSFFKLLNLKGFADSYSMYDIVAKKWLGWGYVYAFVELALGIAFISGFAPLFTNAVTFAVMSVSIIGVLKSVLSKRKIRCACLGDVFNLPMSTVTIVEDALMIGMSGAMIVILW